MRLSKRFCSASRLRSCDQFRSNAQTSVRIDPATGGLGWLTHPYQARYIPPINLANSTRVDVLIRAGNLYLTAQDVIALALENNIDIEVQRYGPLLAREVLRRAEGGSLLRNVGQSVAAGPTSVSLTGVSVNTNGAPAAGGGSGVSAGGGIITHLGLSSLLSFDPTMLSCLLIFSMPLRPRASRLSPEPTN